MLRPSSHQAPPEYVTRLTTRDKVLGSKVQSGMWNMHSTSTLKMKAADSPETLAAPVRFLLDDQNSYKKHRCGRPRNESNMTFKSSFVSQIRHEKYSTLCQAPK